MAEPVQVCGKPHSVQFDLAKQRLTQLAGRDLERIYMIGDNPLADIRGANSAGDPWRSVLVCTGRGMTYRPWSARRLPGWRGIQRRAGGCAPAISA